MTPTFHCSTDKQIAELFFPDGGYMTGFAAPVELKEELLCE